MTSLAQPGAEPHDLELTPQQIEQVATADLVLYLGGLQPAVDDAVEQNAGGRGLDGLAAVAPTGGYRARGGAEPATGPDPHVGLDPSRYAQLATAVGGRLGQVDPDHEAAYAANAAALGAELARLDERFRSGLADCERRDIVTTHNAFGYLAERYGLAQVGIAGLSPEEEPSPQRLDEVRRFAADHGVTTIFYEESVSPEYAETVADQVGAQTAVLSPVEVVDDGEDYFSVMEQNLRTLQAALGCR